MRKKYNQTELKASLNKLNIKELFEMWCKYIIIRNNNKYKLYGRISSLDVEAVKAMVRKDTGNRSALLKYALPVLFEFTGHSNYRRYRIFNEETQGEFITDNSFYYAYISFNESVNSNKEDTLSFANKVFTNDNIDNPAQKGNRYIDRIQRKEKQTLKTLRFLLKQGCNPNDEIFIKNLILKHKYHCKTFFLKLLEMCYNYGLNTNFLLNILKTTTIRFKYSSILYYIRPVLDDIHKNRLSVDDTVQLCIGWASKKNFLYTLINYGRGNLEILNDDVIGVITSFIYFV